MTELLGNPDTPSIKLLNDHLLMEVANGNNDAFRTLYYCTQHAVYGYILSFLKNPQDTEDVMQDTYLRIREKAHLYRPCGKPLAWIFTMAKNLSLMKLRSRNNQSFFSLEDAEESMLTPTTHGNPEDRMMLAAALQLLDEQSRQIVILHAVTGLHHREIAAALGLPLSTVLSRYHRSLTKLQKALQGGEHYELSPN